MDKAASLIRYNQWAQIIRECNQSGQTKQSWCAERNIPIKSFYYYQKKFRSQIAQEAGVVPSNEGFEEVHVLPVDTTSGNISMKAQNFQISIPGNISPESLKIIMETLIHVV